MKPGNRHCFSKPISIRIQVKNKQHELELRYYLSLCITIGFEISFVIKTLYFTVYYPKTTAGILQRFFSFFSVNSLLISIHNNLPLISWNKNFNRRLSITCNASNPLNSFCKCGLVISCALKCMLIFINHNKRQCFLKAMDSSVFFLNTR